MKRINLTPRNNWQKKFEDIGFFYHSIDGLYWQENHMYSFSQQEIDTIKKATEECHMMYLHTLDWIINNKKLKFFGISNAVASKIEESWEQREDIKSFSLYGRFDFSLLNGTPKLLEYNSDTPTGILESGAAQLNWRNDLFPSYGQFNDLDSLFTKRWHEFSLLSKKPVYFACAANSNEDLGNLNYLNRLAIAGGVNTSSELVLTMPDIGWNKECNIFCDLNDNPIESIFKLYPWEWLTKDDFGTNILNAKTDWIEPIYKMILSSKAMLPFLYQLFGDHPSILPAYFSFEDMPLSIKESGFVKKPIYSREGANITLCVAGYSETTLGAYGDDGYVYQAAAKLPIIQDMHICIGSWTIGCTSAGIGIREDFTPITKDTSLFVPHIIE
jgi:glutathionylspermidine synthase